MYSRPANLPGFLMKLMVSSLVVRGPVVKGLGESKGETPKAEEMFRQTRKRQICFFLGGLWRSGFFFLPSFRSSCRRG